MSEITDTLTARVGGLPTWVWGIGAGGLALGALAFIDRRRNAAKPATDAEAEAETQAATMPPAVSYDPDPYTMSPSPMGGGTWAVAPVSGSDDPLGGDDDPDTDRTIDTNAEWQRAAVRFLIDSGTDPILASNAIGRWLSGNDLAADEAAAVRAAARALGAPPDGAPTIRVKPAPTTSTAPKPKPPTPAPARWSPPSYLRVGSFVKTSGGTATYIVRATGIEWIPSWDAYMRLGGFKSQAEALQAPVALPASVMRTFPRLGPLPPRSTDPGLP